MEWTLSSFNSSLFQEIMESETKYCTVAVQLMVVVLFYCQWVAAFHVGISGGRGGPASGFTLPNPLIHHDLSRHYIPHNDIHPEKETSSKSENNDKKRNEDIDTFARRVLESIAKRASYANSEEEVNKLKDNENDLIKLRRDAGAEAGTGLADVGGGLGSIKRKRNDVTEYHAGGCVAKVNWIFYDGNHFPRFLKSYNCSSPACNGNFGECHPKTFIIKVLRRIEGQVSEENCDVTLPEELRCAWKLEPKNVTTYCECRSNQALTLYGR